MKKAQRLSMIEGCGVLFKSGSGIIICGEERLYCASCLRPAEYIPEIESYSCGNCEDLQKREDLITEVDLLRVPKAREEPRNYITLVEME